ncbi:MAG: hypothetical protein RLZ09_2542, partial [Pseudomonadota bacterium]
SVTNIECRHPDNDWGLYERTIGQTAGIAAGRYFP